MMNFLRKQMKWVMAVIVVAFLLSTFLMYEGRTTRRTPSRNADGSMSDYGVAQINGRSLMRSELERRLRDYLSSYSARSAASLDMPAIYNSVLEQVVLESQLAKEVDEKGIRVSDAEADRAMKDYADTYYPTRETFYQALAQSGVKLEDYKRTLARQMAVDRLIRDEIGSVEISEDRAVEFYDTMKGLIYTSPEGFTLHMADFNTSEDAEKFYTKLTAGESWDIIVSNDELSSSDLINITKEPVFLPASALMSGVLSVLASLDIGQPSPVFQASSSDFAVGMKMSHVEESVKPYDEVSGDIRTLLTQQEERTRLNDYQAALRAKAQVTINDEALFARPAVSQDSEPVFSLDEFTEEAQRAESETPANTSEEAKTEETTPTVTEEAAATVTAPEEVKSEETTTEETSTTTEEAAAIVTEEAKPEEAAAATEENTVTTTEETKSEEMTATVTENTNYEETVTEAISTPTEEATVTSPEEETKQEEITESEAEKTEAAATTEEIITKSEDIPVQEIIMQEITGPDEIKEISTEAVIDKAVEEITTIFDAEK